MGRESGFGGAPTILLVGASTTVERGLVDTWVREAGVTPAMTLPLRPEAMAGPLVDSEVRERVGHDLHGLVASLNPTAIDVLTGVLLREVSAMVAEQVGSPEKGEGLGWLARYARAQLEPIGNAYVRFAEPIPLRRALESVDPADSGGHDPGGRRRALQKATFEVAVDVPSAETPRTAGGPRRVLRALAASKVVTIYSGREELADGREAFAGRLREAVAKVVRIDEMDAAARREVAGVAP